MLDYDDVFAKFDAMMEWLARTYVHALNCIHYMHDKYFYERLEMALHDRDVLRTMAFGIAGLSVAADSLSAIRHAKVHVIRDEKGLAVDYRIEGDYPKYGNADPRVDDIAVDLVSRFMSKIRKHPTYRERDAHPVGADHHVQRGVRQAYGQHAGRTAEGRAVRAGCQSDAWPRFAWLAGLVHLGRAAALCRCAGRHQLHRQHRADPGAEGLRTAVWPTR